MPDGALYENSSATVWLRAGVVPPAARSAMAIVAAERVKVLAIACSPALTAGLGRRRGRRYGPAALQRCAMAHSAPRTYRTTTAAMWRAQPLAPSPALPRSGRVMALDQRDSDPPEDGADAEPCLAGSDSD